MARSTCSPGAATWRSSSADAPRHQHAGDGDGERRALRHVSSASGSRRAAPRKTTSWRPSGTLTTVTDAGVGGGGWPDAPAPRDHPARESSPASWRLPAGISGLETTWDALGRGGRHPGADVGHRDLDAGGLASGTVEGTKRVDFAFSNVGGAVVRDRARPTCGGSGPRSASPTGWRTPSTGLSSPAAASSPTATTGSTAPPCSPRARRAAASRSGACRRTLARYLPRIAGVKRFKIDHNRPARLGPLKARRIEFHYRYKGARYWSVGYWRSRRATSASYYGSTSKTTADDRRREPASRARSARDDRGGRAEPRRATVSGSASRRRRSGRRR